MGFQHPGLDRAANSGEVVLLAEAAAAIGAPDPVQALQHADCDPPTVVAQAESLAQSAKALAEASHAFDAGFTEISRGWEGESYDRFSDQASRTQRSYYDTATRTHEGTNACLRVAEAGEGITNKVAEEAVAIAGSATEASRLVLIGETDGSADVVNMACRDIVLTVQDALTRVGDLAGDLTNAI